MKPAIYLALALIACGEPAFDETQRAVVGGEAAGYRFSNVGMYLVVLTNGFRLCTGTLVAPDVVLTAGHCLELPSGATIDRRIFTRQRSVDIRQVEAIDTSTQSVRVAADVRHPMYRVEERLSSDVALLYLASPMEGVPIAEVFDTTDAAELAEDDPMTGVGYGNEYRSTSQDAPLDFDRERRVVELYLSYVSAIQFNTVSGDEVPCFGDSGGPLFAGDRIAGVLSSGQGAQGCSGGNEYARVDVQRTWIEAQMISACADGVRSVEGCAMQKTLLPSIEEQTEARGEALPDLEEGSIEAGDGPAMEDGGCRCVAGRISETWWLAGLALITLRATRRSNPSRASRRA